MRDDRIRYELPDDPAAELRVAGRAGWRQMAPAWPHANPGDPLLEDADGDRLTSDGRDVRRQPFTPPTVTPSMKNR